MGRRGKKGEGMDEDEIRKSVEKHLGYKSHQRPKKCCINCNYSEVANPGANSPGLGCRMMVVMNRVAGLDRGYGSNQVDEESICKFYLKSKEN